MKASVHAVASLTLAGVLWGITRQWDLALAALISGTLVDLDHCYEYFLAPARKRSLRDFFAFFTDYQQPRVYVWLHAWELLLLLLLVGALGWGGRVTWGCTFGLGLHLVLDQLGNGVHATSYWLWQRWVLGFRTEAIYPSIVLPASPE